MYNYLPITHLAKKVKRFFSQRLTSPWLGRIQPKNQKTSLKEQKPFGMFEEICQAVWHCFSIG